MLDKRSCTNVEYPYYINDVFINEHSDGYYFDISNSSKEIRKFRYGKIRLTIEYWNVKVPRSNLLMEITELSLTCKVGRVIYNCQDLLNLPVSVTHPSDIFSEPSSDIKKIKAIHKYLDLVDMFYISYTQVEYDVISAKYLEILFEDSDQETNCRKQ